MDFTLMATIKTTSKAIIRDIKKSTIVATGEKFIEAEVDVYEGDVKIETKKFGYPYETTNEEVVEEIKKMMNLRDAEKVQVKNQLKEEAAETEVDGKISQLKDLEINNE